MLPNENESQIKQLELGLTEPISNKFYYVRGKISYSFRIFETKKFVRGWVLWFTTLFTISLIYIQIYYLTTKFATLPSEVPLLKMYLTLERTLVLKDFLFALPILSVLVYFTSLYITSNTYSKNNYAGLSILLLSTISIATMTFNLIQLIAQYNV